MNRLRPMGIDGAADEVGAEQELRELVEAPGQRNNALRNSLELSQIFAAESLRVLERDGFERDLLADSHAAQGGQIGRDDGGDLRITAGGLPVRHEHDGLAVARN